MKSRMPKMIRRVVLGTLLIVGIGAGLQGCSRGHHSHGGDIEKRMDRLQEEIEEELELRLDQKPAFNVLMTDIRTSAGKKIDRAKLSIEQIREEFNQEDPNIDSVAGIVKQLIRDRSTDEELEGLVDNVAEFYNSLDFEQQATVNKHVKKALNRHSRWH